MLCLLLSLSEAGLTSAAVAVGAQGKQNAISYLDWGLRSTEPTMQNGYCESTVTD